MRLFPLKSFRLSPAFIFESDQLQDNLTEKSARGGVLVLGTQFGMLLVSLLRTALLARLLTPADFGLVGMVAVVVNFAAMFKDAGLSTATVQNARISHRQISTLFWCNIAISAAIALVVCMVSPLVAAFYGRTELTMVSMVLSLSIVMSGIGIQHQALLRRHMRYGLIAGQQVAAQCISLMVAVLLAWLGWRHWALVGGAIAYAVGGSLLSVLACPWIPSGFYRGTGAGRMLRFGFHLTGFNVINYFARNSDNLLIGKLIGAYALGIYERAYQILLLPISLLSGPLSHVAVPALSRLQDRPDLQRKYYLHVLGLLGIASGAMAGCAYLGSDQIVLVLLGERWFEVSDVFQMLAISAFFQPLYNTQSWLHLAIGRSDRVFRWGLIATPLIIGSFVVGLPWGIKGVAIAYSLVIIVVTISALSYAGHYVGITPLMICKTLSRPLLATATATLLSFWLIPDTGAFPDIVALGVIALMYIMLYAIFLLLFFRSLQPFRDIAYILRLTFGGKAATLQ